MTSMEVQISSAWKFRVLIYSRVLDLGWNQCCWFLAFNSFAQCRENNSCEKASYWRVREEIWAYRFSQFFEIKNRTGPNRNRSVWLGFGSVSVCFFKKKKPVWLFFVVKNRTELKMITPSKKLMISLKSFPNNLTGPPRHKNRKLEKKKKQGFTNSYVVSITNSLQRKTGNTTEISLHPYDEIACSF